jgi:2-isopropylmalate synthase
LLAVRDISVDVVTLHQTSVGAGNDSEALTLLEIRTDEGIFWTPDRGRSVLAASMSAVMSAAVRVMHDRDPAGRRDTVR